ncbi:related to KRE6-glucan synthase subunit [Armillaria ostoyae]|uniref:Related to KRE6-glucan synthase subunit n=1 Tax=Armillaria ostoyae TaxID=47428 RepID=A0A284R9Z7_ARMOS|nr:related to KRE6-glucan synthase subunit [Armillaria ostoyae]
MPSLADSQRRYQANSPSTTSLLPGDSTTNLGIHANFARGPSSLRTASSSTTSLFSLSPDPAAWGSDISPNHPEPDDYLHNPDPRRDRNNDLGGSVFTYRGLTNLGCIVVLGLGLVSLFAGYPIISYFTTHDISSLGGFNLGGINASGQVPSMPGNWGMVDLDTPEDAYTIKSFTNDNEYQLVWSDEFNVDGRTFYPGDDPYWEAVDLHYWGTNNLEWYDPASITTKGGALTITLSKKETHGLDYQGGMMSTWNKFCFTGGMIMTSVTLPGANNILGLWPAVWTMGNLGRAGYGASLEGTWPYTYDACDIGTVKNQTINGLPYAATVDGDAGQNGILSFLPGQKLSRCTCPGESHPGPMHSDGTYVGRAAPEIDVFEAQIANDQGEVSQSGQWAPFNAQYEWFNTSDNMIIYDATETYFNTYTGGVFQQATSSVSFTGEFLRWHREFRIDMGEDQNCYQLETGCFAVYGFEYKPGYDDGYITWINNNKAAWTLKGPGLAADTRVEIAARPVPQEPMYIIVNLGMSENFGYVDLDHLTFPTTMSIDYIRVYQPKDSINIGCNPDDFPTQAYIEEYIEAYTNPNLTTWVDDYKQPFPKNSFLKQC